MTDDEPKPSKNWLHFRDVWISTQPGLSGRGGLLHLVAIPHFQSALPRRYLLQAPAIVSLSWLFLSMMMAWLGRRVFDPALHYVSGWRLQRGN